MKKMHTAIFALAAAAGALLCAPTVSVAATDAAPLAAKYNCMACHTIDKKVVGPAFKDIAAKYAGDAGAVAKLEHSIKSGSTGVWGTMPMPPNNVPDADLKVLTEWILAAK